MSIKLILAAAATLATAATAQVASARDGDMTATFNSRTKLFCVRDSGQRDQDEAVPARFRNACRTQRQWRAHGVRFDRPDEVQIALRS